MKDTSINMTQGNAVKLILTFSVPLLIGNIFQQFYNLADSIIVGRFINADALAAIGVTSSITFLFFALWLLLLGFGIVYLFMKRVM